MRQKIFGTSLLAFMACTAALLLPTAALANQSLVLDRIEVPAVTSENDVTVSLFPNEKNKAACIYARFATEDGVWIGDGSFSAQCKTSRVILSPGYGIKGIFAQVKGAEEQPDGTYREVVSNVVFVKLRKVPKDQLPVEPKPTDPTNEVPQITKAWLHMPDPAKAVDPLSTPGERYPHLLMTLTESDQCTISGFNYKFDDDETWRQEAVNRTRPYVHLPQGPTTVDIHVQGIGHCQDAVEPGKTNIFKFTVDVPSYDDAPTPDPIPVTTPKIESVTVKSTAGSNEIRFVTSTDSQALEMRWANEDGNWSGWTGFKGTQVTYASSKSGIKGIFVQVRNQDASGKYKLSEIVFTKYTIGADQPTKPNPAPQKDTEAPVLKKVTVFPEAGKRDTVMMLTADDNVAITQVRFANEDGVWGDWQEYASAMQQTISAGKGYKGVFAQVRDAAGNHSTVLYTKFTVS